MRKIGTIPTAAEARVFSDFLYSKEIENEAEMNAAGTYDMWVHRDEQLDEAEQLLEAYLVDPDAPIYKDAAREGRKRFQEQEKQAARTRTKIIRPRETWGRGVVLRMGKATAALMAASICTFLLQMFHTGNSMPQIEQWFSISVIPREAGVTLYEVRHGEIWRLFTPMFLHFGLMHIFMNMMILRFLGTAIESADGTAKFIVQVLVIAAVSNLAQYFIKGPYFGGMSGVGYGLFGYVWICGKYQPSTGLFIDKQNVVIMLVWAVMGLTGIWPVANGAHFGGLICGVAWAAVRLRRIPFTDIRF
jgi:GlpG protein